MTSPGAHSYNHVRTLANVYLAGFVLACLIFMCEQTHATTQARSQGFARGEEKDPAAVAANRNSHDFCVCLKFASRESSAKYNPRQKRAKVNRYTLRIEIWLTTRKINDIQILNRNKKRPEL